MPPRPERDSASWPWHVARRRAARRLPARCTTPSCPQDDVDERKLDDIYAVAVAHLDLGRVRRRGVPLVRVLPPDRDRDGWQRHHSVLLAVTDDMPFLVDTMRMVLERHGLGIHLLVHPMLAVDARRRRHAGVVDVAARRRAGRRAGCSRRGRRSRSTASTAPLAAELEAELVAAVADVRRVVDDFDADARIGWRRSATSDPVADWFDRGQFVFLGAVDVRPPTTAP